MGAAGVLASPSPPSSSAMVVTKPKSPIFTSPSKEKNMLDGWGRKEPQIFGNQVFNGFNINSV